ncbi:MAG: hypothetical protein SFW67_10310 [Myxococcaceae bacterium]|nr:hypothetical protein [Myxococcaceae bacterium]
MRAWLALVLVVLAGTAGAQPNVRVGGRVTVDVFTRERFGLTRLDATMAPATGPAVDLVVSLDGGRFDLPDGGFEQQRTVRIATGASGVDGGFYRVVTPGPFSLLVTGQGFTPSAVRRAARPTLVVEDFEGTLFDVEEPIGNVTEQLVIGPGVFQQCFGVACVDAGTRPRRVPGSGRGASAALETADPGGPLTHYQNVRSIQQADSVRTLYARTWVRPTVRSASTPASFFRFFELNAGGLALAAYDIVGTNRLRVRFNYALVGDDLEVFTALDGGWRLLEAEVTGLGTQDAGLRTALDGVVVNTLEFDRSGTAFRPTAVIWGSVFSGASGLDVTVVQDDLAVALTPMASRLTVSAPQVWEAGRCEPVVVTLRDSFDGGPSPSYFPLSLSAPPEFTLHTASDCGSASNPTIEGTLPMRTLYARTTTLGTRSFSIDAPTLLPTTPVAITVVPPDGGSAGGAAGGGAAGGGAAGGGAAGGGAAGGGAAGGGAAGGGAAGGGAAGGGAAGGGAAGGGAAGGGAAGGGAAGGGASGGTGGATAGGEATAGGVASDAGPGEPRDLTVGCGCGASTANLGELLVAAVLMLASRRASRGPTRVP